MHSAAACVLQQSPPRPSSACSHASSLKSPPTAPAHAAATAVWCSCCALAPAAPADPGVQLPLPTPSTQSTRDDALREGRPLRVSSPAVLLCVPCASRAPTSGEASFALRARCQCASSARSPLGSRLRAPKCSSRRPRSCSSSQPTLAEAAAGDARPQPMPASSAQSRAPGHTAPAA
eukprot:7382763-Prymnesium_polylepis.2